MGDIETGPVFLAGKGFLINLNDFFTPEQITNIMKQLKSIPSPKGRQEYLKKLFSSIPEPLRQGSFFCKEKKKRVTYIQCLACGKQKGFSLAAWETCVNTNNL